MKGGLQARRERGSEPCEENAIRSPVLVNLKGPVELQVGLLVVVDEAGADRVVAADGPARGGGFLCDCVGGGRE